MKPRIIFAIATVLVFLIALISLIFNQYIQPFMPDYISKVFLAFVAVIGGTMAFLALTNDIFDLVERLFGNTKLGANKYDVYISNSHTDQQFVESIVSNLRTNSLKIWLTEQQILGGQLIEEQLSTAMRKSKSAVFFIGQRGVTNWQEKELNWALSKNVHIIPVLLPGISFSALSSYSSLRDRYTIQFSSLNDAQAFNNLLRGIKG